MDTSSFRRLTMKSLGGYGFLTTRQIAKLTGVGAQDELTLSVVEGRLRRMWGSGLVRRVDCCPLGTAWAATTNGLRSDRIDLPTVVEIGRATSRHGHLTAEVGIDYAIDGFEVTTERELRHFENGRRAELAHGYINGRTALLMPDGSTARRGESGTREWREAWRVEFRPDLVVTSPTGIKTAVEVELSTKTKQRLLKKTVWYAQGGAQVDQVTWHSDNKYTLAALERASDEMACPSGPLVHFEQMSEEGVAQALHGRS
ncbi:hypothetical protein [Nocardioides litoris]|uniref:hypothetical protein n=1 Tax=Nocardioides litoris TaxID=1926648 RepID=UPI00112185B4|nr:hypothetical protein [Nocardioides litoris]